MQQEFKVDKRVVADVQAKHYAVEAAKSVISSMIEAHAMDKNTVVIESPIFKQYQAQYQQKFAEFENAKETMFKDTVDETTRNKAVNWNLDYATCTLVVTINASN